MTSEALSFEGVDKLKEDSCMFPKVDGINAEQVRAQIKELPCRFGKIPPGFGGVPESNLMASFL